MASSLRLFFAGFLVSTLSYSVLAAPPAGAAAPKGLPVKVAKVTPRLMNQSFSAVGTLIAQETVIIRPEIAGKIRAIHFKEGQFVSKGTPLFSLEASEQSAKLAASQADTQLIQQRLARNTQLHEQKFISPQALDNDRFALKQAAAKQKQDAVLLSKTVLRAPFSGVVGLRQISPGAYVQPGQDLVRLEDSRSFRLDFRLPERFLGQLKLGLPVKVEFDAFPNQPFEAQLSAWDAAVDEKSRSLWVRATLPNSKQLLKGGMFARVRLVLASKESALVIPEEAIIPKGKATFVLKVVDGRAVQIPVETGLRSLGVVEVKSGLKAGETIVTEGHNKVQDGMPVTVLGGLPAGGK